MTFVHSCNTPWLAHMSILFRISQPTCSMYRTLRSALQALEPGKIIVAQDVSRTGQKVFYCQTVGALNDMYARLKDKHWYECLVEQRPSRIFLDIESDTIQVPIDDIVAVLKEAVKHKFQKDAEVHVIDSCSDAKQSWHVLCTNIYLKNVYHVGAFVRRFVLSMQGLPMSTAIDTAVYTKNRMFRVVGSSKFGSSRVLKHPMHWHQLLVQNECTSYEECMEIDGSVPSSTSLSPDRLFQRSGNEWVRKKQRYASNSVQCACRALNPVLDWLDRHYAGETMRHNMSTTDNGRYRVSSRSKQCRIAGREHKNNKIWFDILLEKQEIQQRCYDSDCRHAFAAVDAPKEIWSAWNQSWQESIRAPINKNTLFNIVY